MNECLNEWLASKACAFLPAFYFSLSFFIFFLCMQPWELMLHSVDHGLFSGLALHMDVTKIKVDSVSWLKHIYVYGGFDKH